MSNRKFEMYEIRTILIRMRSGDSDRCLAKAGLIGRRKAGELRQLAQHLGWLNSSIPLPDNAVLAQSLHTNKSRPKQQISLVEPYRDQVQSWVNQGVQGTTIHQALIRNYQFTGSYESVIRFVRTLKSTMPIPTVILDFAPGEAAQVDFGFGPKLVDLRTGEVLKSWFFVMTLAFSRHQYAEIVLNQKVETWLECHRRAFEFFNSVPRRLIIDNAKCAITKACYYDPVVQRAYGEYAEGYGFKIDPCPPNDPQKKGRVESGIKYVKRNFLPTRHFTDIHDANRQLMSWVLEIAGNRIHGTTKEKPLTLFAAEKPLLQPLPDNPPELATWAKVKVHRDGHVQFEKCLYSVPFRLMGQSLWLKASPLMIRIFKDHRLIATHSRLFKAGARHTLDDHLPPNALAFKLKTPTWCRHQAEKVGPACLELITVLFADRVQHNLRAAQGILSLEKQYGAARLNTACQRALDFNNPRYGTVKDILKKGLDAQPYQEKAFDELANCYTGGGKYSRNTHDLFKH